ncbi:winged helix-turn-helix transcriptional regulator [Vreelandella rituensis]|uniref:Winged helix-turn-helix transcriptional regulator n=1 Tax=Vreelandella rituensis TaxID=2282306 RepID=A0A368U0C9_9GAMM|nr:winged helix-turn-helix transcriptional regulator [Halomonas rituensis]RCV89947.1 winged helix-turn-helix transcriptional regulator [Halomonas rituensis]
MLSVIAQTLAQNAPVNASVNAPVNVTGLKTPEALLRLLHDNNQLTRQQLADILGKDVRTIARALAKLQQAGKLTRIGSDKTGHWEVHL